jgi:transcriptional regulator
MYVPPAFREDDPLVLKDFIQSQPLGLLISHDGEALLANLVPFELTEDGGSLRLRAHLARANAQWKSLDGRDVLIVFQGVDAYVSPQWYASKREHGKVVPTWNYALVQARGRAAVTEDAAWLHAQVSRLTARQEAGVKDGKAWQVTDAPEAYIASQLRGIVGIEVAVTELTGKIKASQNRPEVDRREVVEGLEAQGHAGQLAMAELVRKGPKASPQ